MQPNDKVRLVKFFKKNENNMVAMCGDGANDCGAILCSDVGCSLNFKENSNITSHFYSKGDSIACVETILKTGRACLENSKIIAKFLIVYSINQLFAKVIMFMISEDFTNYQYYYLDIFYSLIFCLIISMTSSKFKLQKENFEKIGNWKVVVSILSQIILTNFLMVIKIKLNLLFIFV